MGKRTPAMGAFTCRSVLPVIFNAASAGAGSIKTKNARGSAGGSFAPEQAIELIAKALRLCPEITVVGIAGPGDTLATDHALRTFALVQQHYPAVAEMPERNGLLLPQHSDDIAAVAVNSVTVTVNAATPETLTTKSSPPSAVRANGCWARRRPRPCLPHSLRVSPRFRSHHRREDQHGADSRGK